MNNFEFNQNFRMRTMQFSLDVMKFYASLRKVDEVRIMGKQLVRSATSVGANFRAACLARSFNEKFAKFCIVVEEADESIYWLELFKNSHLNINVPEHLVKKILNFDYSEAEPSEHSPKFFRPKGSETGFLRSGVFSKHLFIDPDASIGEFTD